jgi:hypothetical protein
MTIFDSLKYPISNPPTMEQLKAVPRCILTPWLDLEDDFDWEDDDLLEAALEQYINWNNKTTRKELRNLRQLISDYDNI